MVGRHDEAIRKAADQFGEQKARLEEKRLSLQKASAALADEEGRCKAVRDHFLAIFCQQCIRYKRKLCRLACISQTFALSFRYSC